MPWRIWLDLLTSLRVTGFENEISYKHFFNFYTRPLTWLRHPQTSVSNLRRHTATSYLTTIPEGRPKFRFFLKLNFWGYSWMILQFIYNKWCPSMTSKCLIKYELFFLKCAAFLPPSPKYLRRILLTIWFL